MAWETEVQSPDKKKKKMVLDTCLLNAQHYKVHIKDKMEQSREKSSNHLVHLGVLVIEKGAFESTSTTVAHLFISCTHLKTINKSTNLFYLLSFFTFQVFPHQF